MSARAVPSTVSVLRTLMGVTWRRLLRGRALWVSVVIALLPVLLAAVLSGQRHTFEPIAAVITLVSVLLPPMFVASSLGEEIEDRTTTYLWSRPIGRWTVVIGKLVALAPFASLLVVGAAFLAVQIDEAEVPPLYYVSLVASSLAIAALAAGLATLVPKHGMALSIVYLVVFDLALGALPASINYTSITKQARMLATGDVTAPSITMTAIAGVWLAVALWRIRRVES